jgi:hypothetical protein
MIHKYIFYFLLLIYGRSTAQDSVIVLKGATVIDVDNFGRSERDIRNSIVVIHHGKILQVGIVGKTRVPKNAKELDVSGKYIVPGLIDGFGSVTNQAFANAYLYMGVTSVVYVEDDRRGKVFLQAAPSPALYKQDAYWGADRVEAKGKPYKYEDTNYRDDAAIRREIDSMAAAGARVMLVHYGVKPDQLPAIIAACRRDHIATVGELGRTFYREAVAAGIQSFVHTSRYTADVLPDSVRQLYGHAPFGPPASFYYSYISRTGALADPKLSALASLYADHPIGLMPTGSLLVYPYMPFANNPWKEPAAAILDEKDITHEPLSKETGKPINPVPPIRLSAAPRLLSIDSMFARRGARYLTGSGATAFGTLPGISLHTELEMLSHIGLNNRQVIAAATNNFSLLWDWRHIGKIAPGREADLLVLSANPITSLQALKQIEILMVDGRMLDRDLLLIKPH